ncbi:MAG: 6-carboxytetrahydropterin synthase [Acidobacteria bacterium]|nr:6-carboxytetrahydropterin synthase [Acidobacteriota bacterium]
MKLELTRRYSFAASHRLHSEKLSAEENRRIYGKCNNPYGHGHNYQLEVTVSGAVNPSTGMLVDLRELDAFVEGEVIEAYGHKFLNAELSEFATQVPTTENVCREIYKRVARFPGAHLERVRVEETGLNSFEYAGEAGSGSGGTP